MHKNNDCIQIQSHFDNFEAFSRVVQGWGLVFNQLDCGRFKADLQQVATPEILITDAHFNRRLKQGGNQPSGMRTFVIMAESATPFIWRKQQVAKNSLIVFPRGAELDATSLKGFHVYTLSLAEHLIEEKIHQDKNPVLAIKLKQGGVLRAKTSKLQSLRCFVMNVISEVRQRPEILPQPAFQKRLSDELSNHIFDILDIGEESSLTLPFRKRARIVQSVEEWLRETEPENYSVNNLCRTFHLNERTLRRVFEEWYGVSPQQYLIAVRLNGARRELYAEHAAHTQIRDIANRWGFWHMGKFAGYYRRQFLELPSETLRRSISLHLGL